MAWVVDTCLIIDVLEDDPEFGLMTAKFLDDYGERGLVLCPVSYIELSPAFLGDARRQKDFLEKAGVDYMNPWQWQDTSTAYGAWHEYVSARRKGRMARRPVADILIGAYAMRFEGLLTRNAGDFKSIFPGLSIRSPVD